jgi:16S rRNA (adenine1518-N6/adenine1519-N6)-dimethyltransferase
MYSELATPSATRAYLEEQGLHTRKSLGQHFLVDDAVIAKICGLAQVQDGDVVLEAGPGIGTLTLALLKAGARVVAVEKDPRLAGLLGHGLAALGAASAQGSLVVCNVDALEVAEYAAALPIGAPIKLVSNLPYNVGATILLRLFQELPQLGEATVMLQTEVVERIQAKPGRKDYGAYTVKLALLAQAQSSFKVSPKCFLPPPRVSSTVVRLTRLKGERTLSSSIYRQAAELADAAFYQRRKTIRNSLTAYYQDAQRAAELLSRGGIDPKLRGEALPVRAYADWALTLQG